MIILQRTVSFFKRISFEIPTQNNCYQERTLQIQVWQEMVVLWWRKLSQSHSVYTAFFQSTSLRMLFICLTSLTVLLRIMVTKKELFRFKPDKTWLYCGEEDSISLTFTLPFFKALHRECYSLSLHLFNESNRWNFFQEQRKYNLAFLVHQEF